MGGEGAALLDHDRGEAAGGDHVDVLGGYAELLDHPADDPVDLAGEAEDHARLERLDGVLRDHRARAQQLDLAQLGATAAERLQGDVDAGGDGAADVLPARADHVEGGGGAEVDDDRRAVRTAWPRRGRSPPGRRRPRGGCPSARERRSARPARRPRWGGCRSGAPACRATRAAPPAPWRTRRCPAPRRTTLLSRSSPLSSTAHSSAVRRSSVATRQWSSTSPSETSPTTVWELPMSAHSSVTGLTTPRGPCRGRRPSPSGSARRRR